MHRLLALVLAGLAVAGIVRWWWQPRAAAAEASDVELGATLDRMALALAGERIADPGLRTLRWQVGACTQVYALTIDESFADESVGVFLGRGEEHSRWRLTIGPQPRSRSGLDRATASLVSETDADDEPERRELFVDPEGRSLGPAAPDFACRARGWDPLEDALALGWPRLPDAAVRPGDRWTGALVGGRCHETPCLDEQGQFDRARSCQAQPWSEQLAGWIEIAGELEVAVLRSRWDDGHSGELGIVSTRELAIAEGRPLLAQVEVEHRWTGVIRRLELRAIGQCEPG
ncbi:hypothetical protein ACNOYE_08255 [Nannocystaceae bacterium ST9]